MAAVEDQSADSSVTQVTLEGATKAQATWAAVQDQEC
jgi:hypothetical protein